MGNEEENSKVEKTSDHELYRSASDYYDIFMRRHLEYYGYFGGKNASLKEGLHSLQIKQNYDTRLSGRHKITNVEEDIDEFLNRTTQLVFQYQSGRKIPKLREPRNLYALTKEASAQQAIRWPSHVQCICPAVQFIDYTPPEPEPLLKSTGREITPSIRGGQVIYCNDPGSELYFIRSRVAGCRLHHSEPLPQPIHPADDPTLEFESRFESGNLYKVEKISDVEYELTLRPDLYTNKHTQWFFFRIRNIRKDKTYRFTITNLMKPSSLYNNGMQPVFYSEIDAKNNQVGWIRKGENIRYYKNNYLQNGRYHYSLTWTCQFEHDDDTCYFAHCYPYTYSDLQEYLLDLANDPVRSRFCKQRVLCRTLAGNLVYVLTITSPSRNPEVARTKRAVVLTARVHPGETNASWMMKGFLDYLTGNTADAKLLRDTFIFKIIPMLNPDGVIVGNYRCSLTGRDLNRNYKSKLKDSFPSIWHTKLMIKRLQAEREVVLYCDLHGHSRKHNIFIYGCENKHNPDKKLRERVFPLMLSKNSRQSFSFRGCKYKVQKSKEGTGRIVVWYMGVMNSYTLEATFGGTTLNGKYKDTHLRTRDLETVGYDFCDTILDYCDPDKSKMDACMRELTDRMKKRMESRARGETDSLSDSDTSGSDSSCDDGLPVNLLSVVPKTHRKKKLRSRSERNKLSNNLQQKSSITPPVATKIVLPKAVEIKPKIREKKEEKPPAPRVPPPAEDKSVKKLPTISISYFDPIFTMIYNRQNRIRKDEYLQALTSAYIRSGLLVVSEPPRTSTTASASVREFSFKYTKNKEEKEDGNADTGLTAQYLTDRVSQLTANEQYENLRQSALKKQLSAGQQRLLAQKHLAAVASMQSDPAQHQQQINTQQQTAPLMRRITSMTNNNSNNNLYPRHQQQQPTTTINEETREMETGHFFFRKKLEHHNPVGGSNTGVVTPISQLISVTYPIEAKGTSMLQKQNSSSEDHSPVRHQ